MKRFLPYIFILILAVGIFGPIVVDAQGPGMVGGYGTTNYLSQPQEQKSGGILGALYKLLIPADWLAGAVGWIAYEILLVLTAWILGLSGLILDQVIMTTIVTMSDKINAMVGINTAWQITRDIMNIAFIFLLVYEAIMIIISQRSVDSMKKLIGGIILAAILINFSLFFTKILIDASNIITIGLYNSAIDVNGPLSGSVGPTGTQTSLAGLSVPFMKALGFTELWSNKSFNEVVRNSGGSGTSALIFSIAGAVLFLITAFVFFAISIMLIIRFVVLVILLMTSPVAYMGLALPFMKPFATQWWNSLKGQLLFAPIFMFMTLIILTLMGSANFLTVSGASWGDVVNPKGGAGVGVVDLIIKFAVIIGLTIGALVTSKKYAVQGSDLIGTATGKLSAFAGGAVMGSAGWAGRRTVGRAADRLTRSEKFQEYAGKNVFVRQLYKGTQATAGSTFDARNTKIVGKTTDALGMNLGKGSDKTFGKTMEAQTKKKVEFGKSLDLSSAGKEAYIKGLAGHSGILSPLYVKGGSNQSKRSLLGMLGRDDRLAAASLLKDRIKEATAELNAMRAEQNALTAAYNAGQANPPTGPGLTSTETLRLAELTATNPAGTPPPGSLQAKSEEIADLKRQASGLGLDKTQRVKY